MPSHPHVHKAAQLIDPAHHASRRRCRSCRDRERERCWRRWTRGLWSAPPGAASRESCATRVRRTTTAIDSSCTRVVSVMPPTRSRRCGYSRCDGVYGRSRDRGYAPAQPRVCRSIPASVPQSGTGCSRTCGGCARFFRWKNHSGLSTPWAAFFTIQSAGGERSVEAGQRGGRGRIRSLMIFC